MPREILRLEERQGELSKRLDSQPTKVPSNEFQLDQLEANIEKSVDNIYENLKVLDE